MPAFMIARCDSKDLSDIYEIINDAATAYRGIIPADCWHEPYMTREELQKQINEGVEFWHYSEDERILGVMGIQFKNEVTLIRHAYVRSEAKNKGIGSELLKHLCSIAETPILIGTWADAAWAIKFYQKHGFHLVTPQEKNTLLKKYWNIPERQVETSVVLASPNWENNSD